MINEDSFFYLPNLYTFQNKNSFYGSFRGLRFLVKPVKNEEEDSKKLDTEAEMVFDCCTWYGEKCLEESVVVDTALFPLDESGYPLVVEWLDAQYHKMKDNDFPQ